MTDGMDGSGRAGLLPDSSGTNRVASASKNACATLLLKSSNRVARLQGRITKLIHSTCVGGACGVCAGQTTYRHEDEVM